MPNPLEKVLEQLEVMVGIRQPEPIDFETLWGREPRADDGGQMTGYGEEEGEMA